MQSGGITVSIDPGAIAKAVIDALLQGVTDLLTPLPNLFLGWLGDQIMSIWDGIWGSGANLLATPASLTDHFAPAQYLGGNLFPLSYSIGFLAVILLCIRHLFRTVTGGHGAMSDAINNVLMGLMLASVSAWVVTQAFEFCRMASDAIGRFDYSPTFDPHNAFSIGPSFALGVFTLLVMMVYGWKLMVRAAYRIVLLMFMAPFAAPIGALWAIPQARYVTLWYWRMMAGWLAGGILAIGAVSLGVQLASIGNTNGVLSLIFGVALLQVAHDLMGALGGGNGTLSIGSPFGFIANAGAAAVAGGAAGAAVGSAMAVDEAVGALPVGGDSPGLGY